MTVNTTWESWVLNNSRSFSWGGGGGAAPGGGEQVLSHLDTHVVFP